ncbi:MAG TPA: TlpA disulfide reductase family protein [Thermoanaerobaculia bacterium]|nr:TlpA disulfide reductase family protein [Thermoanaerobaculia bacterium]
MGKQARIAVAVLVACALAALFWPKGSGTFKEPGGFLFDAEGKATTLGPKLEPVSLVHFWATWCPPCREEIPSLKRLARDLSNHDDFEIVMVAVADETQKAEIFLGNWATMALYDPNWDVAKRYGTDKLPETYLVVRGEVVKKFVGQTDWDDPELRELITVRLKELGGASRPAGS